MAADEFFSTYDADFFDLLMRLEDEPLYGQIDSLPDDHILMPTTAAEVKLGSTKVPATQQVIGFGHNIKDHELDQFSNGATVKDILRTLVYDVAYADEGARRRYDSEFGEGSFNALGKLQRQILTEKEFNVGHTGAGKFKSLRRAIANGDLNGMREHVRVGSYVTKGGKREFRPDVRRTNYLQDYISTKSDPLAQAVAALAAEEDSGK